MEETTFEFSSIETKHKKEKKELQSKIQALKKVAKNDKTKKKELISEISKLENELEERHKNELEVLNATMINTLQITENNGTTPNRISKAQRRRDKKCQTEKERAELIRLQELENINGPRNLESNAIDLKLVSLGMAIFPIPSDGDCLYKAITHQLEVTDKIIISVEDLRHQVASYIKDNKNDFIFFMTNQETSDVLTDSEFVEYCEKISNTKAWGGQLELKAICNIFKCPIKIIQANGPDSIDQGLEYNRPPLVITYHRHLYSLGEHYNSTQPAHKTIEDE